MKQDLWPDIIQRIQNGETQAFRVIVETFQHPLFVWVARFLGPAAASDTEDIVQDIFLSAYTHIRSFDTAKAGFNTWLFTIARNRCLNELRKKRPEPKADVADLILKKRHWQDPAEQGNSTQPARQVYFG